MAGRDAGHRPQGTAPPRGAAADHRRRRQPGDRVRDNTRPGGPHAQIADLELRRRRRARCEDRIRGAKDTGLANLPLHDLDQNRIWCHIVALACELLAWTQLLGYPTHPARRWEPKRLRLRLLPIAGRLARHTRRLVLHLAADNRWTDLLLTGRAAITGQPRPG